MDISSFKDIPMPKHRVHGPGMNVLFGGKITFNKKLMAELASVEHTVRIRMSPDCRTLLLTGDSNGYKIPARGILMNAEFTTYLLSHDTPLPMHYDAVYDESIPGWLCTADLEVRIDNYVNRATKKRGNKRAEGVPRGVTL